MTGSRVSNPIAIVGVSAIMPDAPDAETFWSNITHGVYSISETPKNRWDSDLYYSEDHSAIDKTYSKIGGWVRDFPWDPLTWRLPIPPRVAHQMDIAQQWSVSAARSALLDAGWPDWDVDSEKVAVVLGNALGGEKHYRSNMRIELPEVLKELAQAPGVRDMPERERNAVIEHVRSAIRGRFTEINEDSMPGELTNVIAGRIASIFNFRGPNYTTDAACASALAAISAASAGLAAGQYDAVVTGGVDRNMGVAAFVKFCKIGALSATGTRPFDIDADGFVMGEGAALFILKRLADAERSGDRIYAVLTGMGASSDGRGKGITAPNPVGQKLAVQRAWDLAGADPASAGLVEAHGTSTRVGDAAELNSLSTVFGATGAAPGSIPLGSVKSNIGHLKAAAGAAGLFKMVKSLHERVLPPSLHVVTLNPAVDWDRAPFAVNHELRDWPAAADGVRRGAVSAFGFGGTNFHAVLEEHVPGRYSQEPTVFASAAVPAAATSAVVSSSTHIAPSLSAAHSGGARKAPLRGAVVVGGSDDAAVLAQLRQLAAEAAAGRAPVQAAPDPALAHAAVRVAIDYGDVGEFAAKLAKTLTAFETGNAALFRMLRSQGVFVGRGPAPKVAFLYTGQGSQYVNMLAGLRDHEPVVAAMFDEADRVMTPLLGRPLSSYIFIDGEDPAAVKQLEQQLLQTEITQPAVLTADLALTALLETYGVRPDLVMGHSLGEYGALVAAGALTFDAALEAVSARGHEMAALSMGDNGAMAAVFAPLEQIEQVVAQTDGYVVIANINSNNQAVIGGETQPVEAAVATFTGMGLTAMRIPVSHAFHTSIVAPASVPLVAALRRLDVRPPVLPIVANVTGEFYPADADSEMMLDLLGKQVASPVQFVTGLRTLYDAGARVFIEVGPKKALAGFVDDVLTEHDGHADVVSLFTNHPKTGDLPSFNQALCGLYAAGLGLAESATPLTPPAPAPAPATAAAGTATSSRTAMTSTAPASATAPSTGEPELFTELGKMFAGVLEQGMRLYAGTATASPSSGSARPVPTATEPVVITGAALGLPGVERTFDDENVGRILAGQQFINSIPQRFRQRMVDMRITRLVKSETSEPRFETIDHEADVIKLAGRHAPVDMVTQFGIDAARDVALDEVSRLAIGVGFDAMRDAGIPLVMRYKTSTLGSRIPDRWGLPEQMRDDTGVIFASAFPGFDAFAQELEGYVTSRGHREQLLALQAVKAQMTGTEPAAAEVDRRIAELEHLLATTGYAFDRRFLFRALAMGHSQFAEIIGARGPNTQVNSACASTTLAVSLAEDWIRAGRARRVIIVAADDATGDALLPWVLSGFLATGAAATDENVEDAATPFDARRHGMIVGMGAAGIVVEAADAARERGLQPICEVLASISANSAFHGTRLDVDHIGGVMESLLRQAEARGVDRHAIADQTVFVSHETYTPARGGSAAAEIFALRRVFGAGADKVVITNTKGFTGHAMGAGIEDVVAIKALETGVVPPVPNYKVPDPELGKLNLSLGGGYPVRYALRLAAGFGSQIAMTLIRWTPVPDGLHRAARDLGYAYRIVDADAWAGWLARVSGHDAATLEVSTRRLRVVDAGRRAAPVVPAAVSRPAAAAPTSVVVAPSATPEAAPAAPVAPQPSTVLPNQNSGLPVVAAVDEVLDAVVGIVADLTGYPAELLDPDLDLEADLGVDTVKQAEVFAAVRERFGVARDENLALRDFPTLTHVVGWVREKTGIAAPGVATSGVTVTPTSPASAMSASAASSAAPASGVPAPSAPAADEVTDVVVGIVADLTGYPAELLDPDLDLEADLGVDTVKQAEVFAAVRERFGLARDENLALRDFPTLTHVIGWVRDKTGIMAPTAGAPSPAASPAASSQPAAPAAGATSPTVADEVTEAVVGIVADLTGYPAELLDPDLDLEADLGVDTVKQAEVFAAVRERFGLARDENLALRDFPTLTHVIGWVRDKTGIMAPTAGAPSPAASPAASSQPAAPTAGATSPTVADEVTEAVVGIVADLTGYPAELLDPDLDLEADLGVDTVKQAEVFAAVRERFGLARDENLALRDFPTLTHVIGWVRDKTGIMAPTAGAPSPAASPAASSQPAAPTAGATSPTVADEVTEAVVGIVADLTGYPAELLDPDLDLEADLGVDTVKQAEVFAAVRERFGLARDENLALRDFPTLTHVIGWVRDKTGIAAPGTGSSTAGSENAAPASAAQPEPAPSGQPERPTTVPGDLRAIDLLPRRLPVPLLRPALAMCKPTGVDLDGARVVLMLDEGGVGAALSKKLTKVGATVLALQPGQPTQEILDQLDSWLADGPIHGVYWLPALDDEGPLDELDLDAWHEALRRRVKSLYATMRRLYDTSPFLITGTRLGGFHGYDAAGATAPLGGAVTGFSKTYKRERPTALVKAVDVPLAGRRPTALADVLIEETLTDPGCVEIGRPDARRFGVGLREVPFPALSADGSPDGDGGLALGQETVFLVTGAAGSIVSAITADLAQASGGTFHLLDLTPTPDAADPDLRLYREDRDAFRSQVAARMKEAGERATPVLIEKVLGRYERLQAALTAVQSVQAAGGTAHYHSVDLTDAEAVASVVESVRQTSGRVDLLLHAAGLEISRALPDKEPREYDLVFDVKSDGWFTLMHAAGDLPIGVTVAFSSVAGRFGNAGQSDYSAANDLLCKITSSLRRSRPETRGIVLDWTAWGGIGMATRGSIPKIMEMAGVQMLPAEAGVAWIRREATSSAFRGEVVVAGVLGAMAQEYDETGGLDLAQVDLTDAGPMIGEVVTASVHHGLVVRTTLDPAAQPFLDHHRMDGTALLPGVMGIEAFAEASSLLAPGWRVVGAEDVSFRAPLKFYRDEPRTLTITAALSPDGDDLLAACRLTTERVLPGSSTPQETVHFTGSVRLARKALKAESTHVPARADNVLGPEPVYRFYFHGPAYQVVGSAWGAEGSVAATLADDLPVDRIPESPLIAGPRLVELCFQTAGLWEASHEGRLALPQHVASLRLLRDPSAAADAGPLTAVATPTGSGFDCAVLDAKGRVVLRLDGYATVALPTPLADDVRTPLRTVLED